MNPAKTELRRQLRQNRLSISEAEHTLKSRAITERLKTIIDWSAVKTVHYFEPIHDLLEVDISSLVTMLEDDYPNVQLFAPRLIGGGWQMISIKDKPVPDKLNVIIVPMLGFDKQLHRVGYGGGYYDRFLAGQPDAKKIGACFENGKVDLIKTDSHDVRLDAIVTEKTVYA